MKKILKYVGIGAGIWLGIRFVLPLLKALLGFIFAPIVTIIGILLGLYLVFYTD